jgi:hypothetical protein
VAANKERGDSVDEILKRKIALKKAQIELLKAEIRRLEELLPTTRKTK